MNRKLTAAALVALALAGCGGDKNEGAVGTTPEKAKAPVAAGDLMKIKATDLMPTKVGTQSVFEVVNKPGSEMTIKVSDVKTEGDRTLVTLDVFSDNNQSDSGVWALSSKGIEQVSARTGAAYKPAQMNLPLPYKEGQETKWTGSGPFPAVPAGAPISGTFQAAFKVRGKEVVETAMGEIEAIAVQGISVYESNKVKFRQDSTTWWAPKYGIVRYAQKITNEKNQTQTMTLRLKNFSSK